MKKILHSRISGFSLIEALIAAVVVAVAMLGLANLQGITLINSADSRMKTHALNLAQDKIEELRGFANQNTYTGYTGSDNNTVAGANSTFTRTWTITDCSVSGNCTAQGNYKQANTTVTWIDRQNATQTVQLTSYIAEADPVKSGVVLLNSISGGGGGGGEGGEGGEDGEGGEGGEGGITPPVTPPTPEPPTPPAPASCNCHYQNAQHGYSLSGTNPSECTVSCCQQKDTGSGNNRYFLASCP